MPVSLVFHFTHNITTFISAWIWWKINLKYIWPGESMIIKTSVDSGQRVTCDIFGQTVHAVKIQIKKIPKIDTVVY